VNDQIKEDEMCRTCSIIAEIQNFGWKNVKGRGHLKDSDIDVRILEERAQKVWTWFIWLRIWTGSGLSPSIECVLQDLRVSQQ
jgi:hypothetical protein